MMSPYDEKAEPVWYRNNAVRGDSLSNYTELREKFSKLDQTKSGVHLAIYPAPFRVWINGHWLGFYE